MPRLSSAVSICSALLVLCAASLPADAAPRSARSPGARVVAAASRPAADSLAGRVVDSAGHPVAGATVEIPELHRAARTRADGTFALADLPAGRLTLVVRRLGYAPLVRPLGDQRATPLELVLVAAATALEPVTVTATRAPTEELASPLPVATLSGERLRAEESVSLAHALSHLPGVRTLSTGEQIGKPVIRGLAGARVLTLESGSRLEDYSWSDEDAPSVDARLAQRVEVIRGPASVLYGSDALGGVVNVIPEPVPEVSGAERLLRTGAEVYGGTNNEELGALLRAEGASGPFGFAAAGIARHAQNVRTPEGELENTGFEALDGRLAAALRTARGRTTIQYWRYGGDFHLLEAGGPPPGPVPLEEPQSEQGPERKTGDDRVQVASDLLAGPVRLEVRGQWQRHSLIELADESGVLNGGDSPVFDLLLNTWTLDLLAHHARGQWLSGTAGVSGMLQDNDSRGPEPLVPDARMRSGAAFVFEEATLGAWSLLGGARVDRRRLAADANVDLALAAQRRDYTAATGDLGVIFRPAPPLALALNVGRAWRAPTLFELFANGPNEAEGRYEMGRADLQAETGVDADVSLRWRLPRLRGEVTGFRNAMSHFVYITPTASQIDGLQVYRYLQADALLSGFEAWTEVDAWRTLTLRARLDGVRGTNRDANEPLPLVPPLRYAGAAEWHAVDVGPLERARLGVEVEHVTEQRRLNPLDIPTGAYTLLELTGGAEARLLGRGTRLDVTVRNAADVRYRSFLSRYKRFALDPGRNVVVRLSTVW